MGTTYTSALTALRAHFVPQVNTIAEHHKESKGMMKTFCKMWPRSGIWCLLVHLVTKKRKCSEIKSFEKVHSCQFFFFLLEADLTLDKAIQITNQLECAMAKNNEFAKPAELSEKRLYVRNKKANAHKGTQLKQQSWMREYSLNANATVAIQTVI